METNRISSTSAVEWTYFDRDVFATGSEPASSPSAISCSDYVYDDELPIYVCSQGYSVELFQEALGLPADGYFGPGTETAVRDFQAQAGLAVTGVIDAPTWSALGVTGNAPFPDLNGDGVIDGSEFRGCRTEDPVGPLHRLVGWKRLPGANERAVSNSIDLRPRVAHGVRRVHRRTPSKVSAMRAMTRRDSSVVFAARTPSGDSLGAPSYCRSING